jgi:alkaline phosphatase
MIGDGMGPAYTTAYRYFKDDNTSHKIPRTVFDTMLVGMNSTYSHNSVITDSAAAATALACSHKNDNGLIGLKEDTRGQVMTLFEAAKAKGYRTGFAVACSMTHATPAAFLAKGGHLRDNEAEIAKDYLKPTKKGKLKFDLLIGGGEKYFQKAFKDFNTTASDHNITLYRNAYDVEKIKKLPAMAFTVYGDYPHFAIDETPDNRHRVAKMTRRSLQLLEDKPFFLMIEGSQIDWCGHLNDIACAMREMEDFALAVRTAKHYVDTHSNTLLVITADHSTGGLAIGDKVNKKDAALSKKEKAKTYTWYKNVVKKVKGSSYAIAKALRQSRDINATFKTYTDIILTAKEYNRIKQALVTKKEKVRLIVNDIINKRSHTGWSTHGHTAVDVQTFAYGKKSDKFRGSLDNTDISKKLFEVIEGK